MQMSPRGTCQTHDNRDWRVTRARITAGQSSEYAQYICDDVAADIYKNIQLHVMYF